MKRNDDHVPSGYKRTEIGVIPEDWSLGKVSDLFLDLRTASNSRSDLFTEGEVFYVHYGDIHTRWEHYVDFDADILPKLRSGIPYNAALLQDGDLILADASEDQEGLGKSVEVKNIHSHQAIAGLHTILLRPKIDHLAQGFLGFLFSSPQVKNQLLSIATGLKVFGVSKRNLRDILLPLPPLAEQRAIADALSDVDALIASLDALIAKKRDIKKATMQQLLTGKMRLPGFSGAWEERRLGEIGHFSKGRGVTRSEAQSGTLACIRYGEIYTTHHYYIREFQSWISPEVSSKATRIHNGDILFAGSGETKEEIGKCVAFVGKQEAYAGGDIVILRPFLGDSLFLGYALNTSSASEQKARLGQGDAVVHIYSHSLSQVSIPFPSLAEQRAIAAVLADMDAEIEELQAQREKTEQVKQGMMQQLLTGRVRLTRQQSKVIFFPTQTQHRVKKVKQHNQQIDEDAIIIGVLADRFGEEEWPLGAFRRNKFAYLLERRTKGRAEGYLKKPAGPYKPTHGRGRAEETALSNGYIRFQVRGLYKGYIGSRNVAHATEYFLKKYGTEPLEWLEKFRRRTNPQLELLTTVDMAAEELRASGKEVSLVTVKQFIHDEPEWRAKLDKPCFSDGHIERAIRESQRLFHSNEEPAQ